jgi:hypothetical protein
MSQLSVQAVESYTTNIKYAKPVVSVLLISQFKLSRFYPCPGRVPSCYHVSFCVDVEWLNVRPNVLNMPVVNLLFTFVGAI